MESHDTSQLSKSHFHKAVGLDDWWLIEAENEGRRLAVAGLSIKHGAARLFSSAPIIKRINQFCLETADDITVNLGSFINTSRTTENGFSHEVFNHFQYGFPPYWEEYAEKYFVEDSTGSVSAFDKLAVDSVSSKGDMDIGTVTPSENGSRSTRACSRSRKGSWKKKASSKAVENPHEEKLKGSSTQVNISTGERDNNAEVAATSRNKAKRKLPYDLYKLPCNHYASPSTRGKMKKDSILSPDSFKRSRAGRLLLPKLDFWRNEIAIYDMDGRVTAVKKGDGEESSGSLLPYSNVDLFYG